MSGPDVLAAIDRTAFRADVDALHAELKADLGEPDLAHLRRMVRWGRICSIAGYALAWPMVNPLAAILIGMGNVGRWASVTHPVMHRGYDAVPGVPDRYRSRNFAIGWRRYLDWLDWLHPDAWAHEHNQLHHYHTGQRDDPDIVERNAWFIRHPAVPRPVKWLLIVLLMMTWKLQFYLRCVMPYALFRFALLPALFLPLGTDAWLAVLINSVLAEIVANVVTFVTIAPNHTGEDVYAFDDPCRNRAEFYVRQAAGSVNYPGGTDLQDFAQGYLNYQIEHHFWPDLPLLKYRQAAPRLKEICRRHGVPYIEESVFRRFGKLWSIMMGDSDMRRERPLISPQPLSPCSADSAG